jgi:dienelactone hydrolase
MAFSRSALLLGFAHVALAGTLGAQAPAGGLPAGTLPVGFTLLARMDSSRASSQARLLDVGVWYPAREAPGARLTYRDYVLLTPMPRAGGPATDSAHRELDGLVALLVTRGAADTIVRKWLGAPMLAARNAPPAGGRFPLVLIAQGNAQTVHDQAPLAEYLASFGYVVATTPSPMRVTPLTDEHEMGPRAGEQALDLAFALEVLAARLDVLDRRIGLVGHSFGARAALLLAMLEPRVSAVVSLDGGIGTATGRSSLEALPSYRTASMRAPILHFYEELDPFMAPDFGLMRTLTGTDRWLVSVPALHHHHFTSLGAVSIEHPSLRSAIAATAATPRAYGSVARATREFLDAFVKEEASARKRFRPGVSWEHLGKVERLAHESD